jgi:hypothetical protein
MNNDIYQALERYIETREVDEPSYINPITYKFKYGDLFADAVDHAQNYFLNGAAQYDQNEIIIDQQQFINEVVEEVVEGHPQLLLEPGGGGQIVNQVRDELNELVGGNVTGSSSTAKFRNEINPPVMNKGMNLVPNKVINQSAQQSQVPRLGLGHYERIGYEINSDDSGYYELTMVGHVNSAWYDGHNIHVTEDVNTTTLKLDRVSKLFYGLAVVGSGVNVYNDSSQFQQKSNVTNFTKTLKSVSYFTDIVFGQNHAFGWDALAIAGAASEGNYDQVLEGSYLMGKNIALIATGMAPYYYMINVLNIFAPDNSLTDANKAELQDDLSLSLLDLCETNPICNADNFNDSAEKIINESSKFKGFGYGNYKVASMKFKVNPNPEISISEKLYQKLSNGIINEATNLINSFYTFYAHSDKQEFGVIEISNERDLHCEKHQYHLDTDLNIMYVEHNVLSVNECLQELQ